MSGPPLEIHFESDAKPRACHTPAHEPIHWQKQVEADLIRDEKLGVLERVPFGEPVSWYHGWSSLGNRMGHLGGQ